MKNIKEKGENLSLTVKNILLKRVADCRGSGGDAPRAISGLSGKWRFSSVIATVLSLTRKTMPKFALSAFGKRGRRAQQGKTQFQDVPHCLSRKHHPPARPQRGREAARRSQR